MPGYTIPQVREIAKKHQYKEIVLNEPSRLISFRKEDVCINVYYTTGTVGTCLNHPRQGKTQLFWRNVTLQEIDSLFAKPRKHTGKRYYHKHVGQNGRTVPMELYCRTLLVVGNMWRKRLVSYCRRSSLSLRIYSNLWRTCQAFYSIRKQRHRGVSMSHPKPVVLCCFWSWNKPC